MAIATMPGTRSPLLPSLASPGAHPPRGGDAAVAARLFGLAALAALAAAVVGLAAGAALLAQRGEARLADLVAALPARLAGAACPPPPGAGAAAGPFGAADRNASAFPRDFWFVKPKKVGGTKLAGVFRNICAHTGTACMNPPVFERDWEAEADVEARARAYRALGFRFVGIANHGEFRRAWLRHLGSTCCSSLAPPLLFTAVREPGARTVSQFFYEMEQKGRAAAEGRAADPNFPGAAERGHQYGADALAALAAGRALPAGLVKDLRAFLPYETVGNGLFNYIKGDAEDPAAAVAQYDFVFVAERFDESLVAFGLAFGVTLRELAYMEAYDKVRTGKYPLLEQLPADLQLEIAAANTKDTAVYAAALARLDAAIEEHTAAGRFAPAAAAFAAAQAAVAEACAGREGVWGGADFKDERAYYGSKGTGRWCVDEALRRLDSLAL